ncbi:hypothetical protein WA026_023855 [Henosepilachna vigintioctopunctata]|uniref:Uncharacterized protein n=1 Tax=Henosepilachna vigintioctopunctata TaxID=420089 RepID=A0AAW1UCV4_9CUCU
MKGRLGGLKRKFVSRLPVYGFAASGMTGNSSGAGLTAAACQYANVTSLVWWGQRFAGPACEHCDRGNVPVEDDAGQKHSTTGTEMTQALAKDMDKLTVKKIEMKTATRKTDLKNITDTKGNGDKEEEISYTPDRTSQ